MTAPLTTNVPAAELRPDSLQLAGVSVRSATERPSRFSMLLWGMAKCGKTTLAATAPGKKLWLNLDPDGTSSLYGREDVLVADLSTEPASRVVTFAVQDDPFGISTLLKEHPDIETVVLDSLTVFGQVAFKRGCELAKVTEVNPGFDGYRHKNVYVNKVVKNLLDATRRYNRNCIIISHEDTPDKDKDGSILSITMMLGKSLNAEVSLQPSEVWHLRDDGNKRIISIRPCRNRQPMGSRMFITNGAAEFEWKYDPMNGRGEGIADWFKRWQDAGTKIPVPA